MVFEEIHEHSQRQLHDIANAIAAARKIVVITGAGISTNCGIPDFRSEHGLYQCINSQYKRNSPRCPVNHSSQAQKTLRTNAKGKDLFDSMIWRDEASTSTFFKTMASLRQSIHNDVKRPSNTHRFIRTLRDRRKLVRCYTQNIDGLEQREGLCADLARGKGNRSRFTKKKGGKPPNSAACAFADAVDRGCEVVPLHGDLQDVRCTLCQQLIEWDTIAHTSRFLQGRPPRCGVCLAASESRQEKGKRGMKIGILRPNVVLYGEEHPQADAISGITTHDLGLSPDLLLVMGTSLHVHGLKTLVREFAKAVHARPNKRGKVIFINATKPAESAWKDVFDHWVGMDCDQWVAKVRSIRPDIWQVQARISAQTTKTKVKTKSVKPKVMDEADKENIILDSEDSDHFTNPVPNVVIVTPKKDRQPFQAVQNLSTTPTKGSCSKRPSAMDSELSSSLPTPPVSKGSSPYSISKRSITESVGTSVYVTPSKRRKVLQIWED